jgi:hypothetical protein
MVLLPVDYGLLCLVFLFAGNQRLFLALYVILLAAHVTLLSAFLAKWFRELTGQTRTRMAASGGTGCEDARYGA